MDEGAIDLAEQADENARRQVSPAGAPMTRGGLQFDEVGVPAGGRHHLVGESLRQSFPLEGGDTLPAKVVQLMLFLAHHDPETGSPGEIDRPSRTAARRKRSRSIAALVLAAILLRARSRIKGVG